MPRHPGLVGLPSRSITHDEVETFWRDGVVVLRGILSAEWIRSMVEPVERVLRRGEAVDLGPISDSPDPSAPTFAAGVDHWRHSEAFSDFAIRSPLVPVVATLLRSERLWLWEDSVVVKEPGSPYPTRFHTDRGYLPLDGDRLATVWVPIDPTTSDSGMVQWVRGSHLEIAEYRPHLYVNDEPLPDTEGDLVPDVLGDPALRSRLITFDLEPGDVTVHHARTLHGAPANTSQFRRRAVAVRYGGDDVRYRRRPGLVDRHHARHLRDGDALGTPDCPKVWPR